MNQIIVPENIIEGALDGSGLRIAIVQARFNRSITDLLVAGAVEGLCRHQVAAEHITLLRVPGSFEITLIAQQAAESKRYDAIICVGAVIRGETAHFDAVATQTAAGIAAVSRQTRVPVIFGVLTTDTIDQAWRRSGIKGANAGWNAAVDAIEMANLMSTLANEAT